MFGRFHPCGYEKAAVEHKNYVARYMTIHAAQILIINRGIGKILTSLNIREQFRKNSVLRLPQTSIFSLKSKYSIKRNKNHQIPAINNPLPKPETLLFSNNYWNGRSLIIQRNTVSECF